MKPARFVRRGLTVGNQMVGEWKIGWVAEKGVTKDFGRVRAILQLEDSGRWLTVTTFGKDAQNSMILLIAEHNRLLNHALFSPRHVAFTDND